ncbi:MAG: hypothetical protein ACQESN_04950 [Thermotogota bacterium]
MKKLLILLIMIISSIGLTNPLSLIFKDAMVNFVEMEPGIHELEENQNILWVEGSDSWSIKKNNYNFNFQIISLEEVNSEIKEIDDNVFEIVGKNQILFYYSKLGKWALTSKENLRYIKGVKSLHINSKTSVYVATYKQASWKMIYELNPDGKFSKNIEILNTVNENKSRTYIINDYLRENIQEFSMMTRNLATESKSLSIEENIIQDVYTLFLGNLKLEAEKTIINIENKKIKLYEDYLQIPLNSSAKNANPYIIRYILNTKDNGIGIEIPAGELWINQKFDNKVVPLSKIKIDSYSIGEKISLKLDKSWNFNYSNTSISDVKVNDDVRMIQRNIKLNNNSEEFKWVKIQEISSNLQLEDFSTNDDYDTLINDSKKGLIDIKIKLKPNSSINLNIIYKK